MTDATSRTIDTHKINPCNDILDILVIDEPGPGGANHFYVIQKQSPPPQARQDGFQPSTRTVSCQLKFQNGPIAESGVNGITNEALLAILIDRMQGFQSGPYACKENADALFHLNRAMLALKARTESRLARGVEGTHAV